MVKWQWAVGPHLAYARKARQKTARLAHAAVASCAGCVSPKKNLTRYRRAKSVPAIRIPTLQSAARAAQRSHRAPAISRVMASRVLARCAPKESQKANGRQPRASLASYGHRLPRAVALPAAAWQSECQYRTRCLMPSPRCESCAKRSVPDTAQPG